MKKQYIKIKNGDCWCYYIRGHLLPEIRNIHSLKLMYMQHVCILISDVDTHFLEDIASALGCNFREEEERLVIMRLPPNFQGEVIDGALAEQNFSQLAVINGTFPEDLF